MAENKYSEHIKKAILDFANSCNGKYKLRIAEGKIWLKAPHTATSFYQFPYKPEVRLTKGDGHHTIFEVLDSQLKDPNLIIADIIQALLVDGAESIIFIAPTDEGYEKARELSETITGLLISRLVDTVELYIQKNMKKKIGFLKRVVKTYSLPEILVYKVSYKEANNSKLLQKLFAKWSKKDRW